jgi:cytochrome c
VQDPKAFLAEFTGDSSVRSNMRFKLARGAEDVVAYLASVAP